jgi:tRNA pseudouridine32 synthase / 23S rRNA pseudouridine746 synthase
MTKVIEILHTDDALVVVNKPAGVASVPGGWNSAAEPASPSLFELLEAQVGKVWIVHRLDRVTSGVMLFARTASAHRTLSMLFESRQVQKIYHALCSGTPGWEEHTARHPLRFDVGHAHRTVVDHRHGAASETYFRLLERMGSACLLEARPGTGRTHQVRVHASALGFPILGDTLYQGVPSSLIARPALHAFSLAFDYEGQAFTFSAPYPDDFSFALKKLRAGR